MIRMSRKATLDPNKSANLKVFGILTAGGVLGSLASLPYIFSLIEPPSIPIWQFLLLVTIQASVQTAFVTGLGLWLGGKVGLGAPVLKAWLAGDPQASHRFRASLPISVGAGVVVAGMMLLLEIFVFVPLLPDALRKVPLPSLWQGFLASFYGGITEELLLRLGLMTLLVWLGTKLTRQQHPKSSVMWSAIALTALIFGAGHLPITARLVPLTPFVVTRALLLNGIPGLLFGWLYWRKGLLAAMVAHFWSDIVLHVIGAALFLA